MSVILWKPDGLGFVFNPNQFEVNALWADRRLLQFQLGKSSDLQNCLCLAEMQMSFN